MEVITNYVLNSPSNPPLIKLKIKKKNWYFKSKKNFCNGLFFNIRFFYNNGEKDFSNFDHSNN